MTKLVRTAGIAAAFAAAIAMAAPSYAGEVNGRGDPIPATDFAHSACAFSGQNDHPLNPPDDPDFGGRVQNFHTFLVWFALITGVDFVHPLDSPFRPGADCRGNVSSDV